MTAPWIIVSEGFHFVGGQDKAVAGLADYLARSGRPVHLVANTVDAALTARQGVVTHRIPRIRGVNALGNLFFGRAARRILRQVLRDHPDGRIVVTGGNCIWGDINWVHYLHHAWVPELPNAPLWFQLKERVFGRWYRRRERQAIQCARIVISNSHRTAMDVLRHMDIPANRVRTVYLGADPSWLPATHEERRRGRELFGLDLERPIVAFVGGLGHDRRKGFDTLLEAWRRLCQSQDWDADLVMAGGGKASAGVAQWLARHGLGSRVRLVGFTNRVFDLLAASDLLVSPVRYEPYGLNVQEAICRGLPAVVSAGAGVAEVYSSELAGMLLHDPNDPDELAHRLRGWRADMAGWRSRFRPLSERMRGRTWDEMAQEIVTLASDA